MTPTDLRFTIYLSATLISAAILCGARWMAASFSYAG
jgi:hypothetical protein